MKRAFGLLLAGGLGCTAAHAAITLSFDASDSNVHAGIYAFMLSGIVGNPTYNSQLTLYNFYTIGNGLALQATASPSGWGRNGPNDVNSVRWYADASGVFNGVFEVTGTPNLSGLINWDYADPGHALHLVGNATILAAVPEPALSGLICGSLGLLIFAGTVLPRLRQKCALGHQEGLSS